MKRKKWIALALTLLMMLSLAPAALASDLPFPAEWFAGFGGFSLRDMIDPNKGNIDLAGSSFQLENLIFFDDAVVDEESEICLVETSKDAMILDESALPDGLKAEVRKEKVRVPDGRDGVWVADEIRRERAGQPAPDEPELNPADKDRETYYLYLTGKPEQAGEYLFVLWDGTIKLCSVTVLNERPEPTVVPTQQVQPTEPPAQQETWVDPWTDPNTVTETWVDPNQQNTTPTDPPAPTFILPTPSVSVTGGATVAQGESVVLEAQVSNDYNPAFQWYVWDDAGQSWQILNGQTGTQLRPDTSAAGTRAYLCQVTNSYNDQTTSAWSEYVAVTVEAAPTVPNPTVTGVTGSTTVEQGQTAVLEVHADNTYNASYQWYANNTPINGANASQYQPDTSAPGTQIFVCQVTNSYNGQTASAYSDPVTFTVEAAPTVPAPTVTGVTGSTKVEQGASAVLEVHATDTYNASYQWYENNTPISGANASQYRPDTSEAGTQTFVCQVTNSYNGQSASAYSDPVTFTVEAKPTLPTPTVSITGANKATVGDSVLLEARVSNGYNVSYQWFTSLGYYDAPIQSADATRSQFKPDTSKAGTWKYFCRITSSGYGETITVDSEPVTFTVAERVVVTPTPTPNVRKTVYKVEVAKLPNKLDYNDGEAVDATGLQLRVRYTDGSYETIAKDYVVTTRTVSYNNSGLADVNVNYKGYQTSYQVKVHSVAELVRGIGVLTMPNKSSYTVGEYLNTAGLSIRVYSTDGRYLDVSEGFECSPTYFNRTGNQTVTVSFMGKTCTFTVAVQDAKRVVGLTIQSLPANRSYTVGDTISTAGLVLQLQTTSGYETITSGFTISPRVATTAGSQLITVNYEGMSTSFTVDVRSNIPYATPTPAPTPYGMTPTPMPYGVTPSPVPFGTVSPSPSGFPTPSASPNASPTPTPIHTPTPARRNTGVSTAVKVLFAVAVVSLGGLIGYVIYLRKTDGDEFIDEPSLSEKIHNLFNKKK
ncbi:MAG: bacterial Ig-like domain-containing protein [Oscillospiraceae bacterium]|nr:bacterial Ig-like domain-containing protein [Oscillospiraceae bacterium]